MKGRPPKRTLTPEQERAANAFVGGAEEPGAGSGPATPPRPARTTHRGGAGKKRPWEADRVRDDVVKGYALRLPEPLYLKLKWVAERTGRSMNAVCREAVEAEVEAFLAAEET